MHIWLVAARSNWVICHTYAVFEKRAKACCHGLEYVFFMMARFQYCFDVILVTSGSRWNSSICKGEAYMLHL